MDVSPSDDRALTPGGPEALVLAGITKRFGDVTALDGADLVVPAGHVHALLGENGAGKSTLMRIAYGLIAPDSGTARVFSVTLRAHSVRESLEAGVGMVHQHLSIAPGLSVAENFQLGRRGAFDPRRAAMDVEEASRTFGLHVPLARRAGDLSVVEQQRLEILKALGRGARVLILDEPTAVLAPAESEELMRWIRTFASAGGSVVLVTHKLREALAVADDVTVLRAGRVTRRAAAAATSERDLAHAMFPDAGAGSPDSVVREVSKVPGEPIAIATALRLTDAGGVTRIRDATFTIRRGDIVGIAGVDGSGHRELLLALGGFEPGAAPALVLPDAIAFIPADRLRDGVVPDFTLSENVALRGAGRRRGFMHWRGLVTHTERLMRDFAVQAASPRAMMRSLSGGNQQRLILARELDDRAPLIVADSPTRGLDLQGVQFVHARFRAAAAAGAAVVLHSSDVDELLGLITRALVVFGGTVHEVPVDRAAVGRAMLGAA